MPDDDALLSSGTVEFRQAERDHAAGRDRSGLGSWYFVSVRACAICGHTTVDRERRHDPRPDDPADRREYVETACQGHFL